ncbi:hypothetical protein HYX13_03940 [Candidatus Woesearchaeota archaeon]|nr:hypothetical protein [Candidatus Woesearchaeota archaeon]
MKLKDVENKIRDLVNWIAVKQLEEVQDVTSKIEPQTAKELSEKLSALAVLVGNLELEQHAKKAKKSKKKTKPARKAKKKRI